MTQELEKKIETWGNFAAKMWESEIDSLSKLDEIKEIAKAEITVQNEKESEGLLKLIKSTKKEIAEIRSELTKPLDNLKARLMMPEKEAAEHQKEFETKLLEIKKVIAAKRYEAEQVQRQEQDFIMHVKKTWAALIAHCDQLIHELASSTYSAMLNNKVAFNDFDAEAKKVFETFTVPSIKEWFLKCPAPSTPNVDESRLGILYTENKRDLPNYSAIFKEKMSEYKAGYNAELNNIEEAQKRLAAEKLEAEKRAKEFKAAEELKAKFDAVPVMEQPSVSKAAKQIYVIDMEENLQTAMLLYATLSANQGLILPKLRVKNWLELKPSSIVKVLEKLKSENNSLDFEGINFKIDYKL